MCCKELDKRFAVIGSRKVTKQARVEATVLNSLTPISKADVVKILPDGKVDTGHLKRLLRDDTVLCAVRSSPPSMRTTEAL